MTFPLSRSPPPLAPSFPGCRRKAGVGIPLGPINIPPSPPPASQVEGQGASGVSRNWSGVPCGAAGGPADIVSWEGAVQPRAPAGLGGCRAELTPPAMAGLPWRGLGASLLAAGGAGRPSCWVGSQTQGWLLWSLGGPTPWCQPPPMGPATLGAGQGGCQAPTEPTEAAFAEPWTAHGGATCPEPGAFPHLACGPPSCANQPFQSRLRI